MKTDAFQKKIADIARVFKPSSVKKQHTCENDYILPNAIYKFNTTIASSAAPVSSYPQSFPASGSFPMSWLFTPGGRGTGASASASVLPINIQD